MTNQYQPQWQPQPYQPPVYRTKKSLSGAEHIVHAIFTVMTLGLWGFVWAARAAAGRREVMTAWPPPQWQHGWHQGFGVAGPPPPPSQGWQNSPGR